MSSLLEQASICITPNGVKAGKLYGLKGTDLDVVRATTATRVNSAGLIETVANNVARLDYTNGSCPSILVEPQRTNLVFPSEVATTQSRTVTATAHTLSFYGTGTVILSGVAIATLVGTGANNRVTLTFTPTAGVLLLTIVGSVNKWQLEAGANATSYIPTVATTSTRNADVISKTGIADLIGQTEGTLYSEIQLDNFNLSRILEINDGSSNNRILFQIISNNRLNTVISQSGTTQAAISTSTLSNGKYKIAVSYLQNNVSFFVNGILIGTDEVALIPMCNQINLGSDFIGSNVFSNRINSTIIFKTKLTDQECINLTTL